MTTIVKKNDFTEHIIGLQKININKKYRFSKYTVKYQYNKVTLLYNTMTQQLIVLNDIETQYISKYQTFNYCDAIKDLIQNWFLVDMEYDEKETYDQLITIIKATTHKDAITSFVIYPTTDCNARCFYCFELDRSRINMTQKTAEDVCDYIISVSKGYNIKLHWFGGEPLYNAAVINTICSRLSKVGINFKSYMVSNGYLFDDEMILQAKKNWNLKRVQITLDGTEEVYNKTKAYIHKDSISPFKKVYSNIKKLLDNDISIKVRLNMDMYNIENLYELVNKLKKDFGTYDKFKVYPAVLFEEIGADKIKRSDMQRNAVYDVFLELCEYLAQNNLFKPAPLNNVIKINKCMADNDSAVQILPNGKLGKCEHFTESEFIGSIYDNKTNYAVIQSFKEKIDEIPYCKDCKLYPLCIELKKCKVDVPFGCMEGHRKEKMFRLIQRMKLTYDLWVKEQI